MCGAGSDTVTPVSLPAQSGAFPAPAESPDGAAPLFSIEFGKMLCMGCRPAGRCRFGLVLSRGENGAGWRADR